MASIHYEATEVEVTTVVSQSPVEATEHDIRAAISQCNGDLTAAVSLLWGLEARKPEQKSEETPEQTQRMWSRIREICDAYDTEMENLVKRQEKEI